MVKTREEPVRFLQMKSAAKKVEQPRHTTDAMAKYSHLRLYNQ